MQKPFKEPLTQKQRKKKLLFESISAQMYILIQKEDVKYFT